MTPFTRSLAAVAGVVALAASCSPDISAPTAALRSAGTADALSTRHVYLCKVGPTGTTATFTVTATGGTVNNSTITLNAKENVQPADCPAVWTASGDDQTAEVIYSVTVTEVAMTPGISLTGIFASTVLDGSYSVLPPANSITVDASFLAGATVTFKNGGTPQTGGGQGCTPGYWKQKQHFDSWAAPYTPTTQFGSVFANAFPNMTLLQVLGQGGGGLKALGRHTVAALLNSASGGVDYQFTTGQVIAAFNAAYASGDYETQKNIFAAQNESGCGLN